MGVLNSLTFNFWISCTRNLKRRRAKVPIRFPRHADGVTALGVSTKLIRRVIKKLNKDYKGKRKLSTLGNSVFSTPRHYISTGVLSLDCVICFGMGFPVGIVEIFGPEASGKTAILEQTLAESQKKNYYTIIFAQEFSLNYQRVRTLGLEDDKLIIGDAETIEEVYDQIRSIVRGIREKDKATPIVIGWDTIAATPTRAELAHKAGLDASDMGHAAAQISKLFRRLVRFLFENNVCLICINQTRTNLAVRWGSKESTFGGRALRFYAWVRMRVVKIKDIKNSDDEKIGFLCLVEVKKNKVAPPHKQCIIPIYYSRGIDAVLSIWEYCVDRNIVKKNGTAYKFGKYSITRKTFAKFYKRKQLKIDRLVRQSTVVHEEEKR
jgi:recombination protein RecA